MTDGKHKASVTIDAKVDAADRNIKKLTRRINSMERELSRSGKAARKNAEALRTLGRGSAVAATAAAGAVVGLFKLAEASAEAANNTAKVAKGLGVAADGLQRLEFATSRATKATSEQLHKGIAVLTVGLQDAVTKGTGPVAEGLDAIGLSADDLMGMDIEQQFGVIAEALKKVPLEADKSAISMKLFGRRAGTELKPLLDEGITGLNAYGQEAERLGLVLDQKALAASEEFIDSLSDMKKTVAAVARDVGMAATPAFKDAADGVKEWTVENRELIDQNLPKLIEQLTTGMTALASATLSVAGALSSTKDGFDELRRFTDDTSVGRWILGLQGIELDSAGRRVEAGKHARFEASAEESKRAFAAGEYEAQRTRALHGGGSEVIPLGDDLGGYGPSDATLGAAEKARRDALRRIAVHNQRARAEANKKKPKKHGARREKKSLLESMLEEDQAYLSSFSDDVVDTSFLDSETVDPFSLENRQYGLDELARMAEEERAIEKARREGLLQDQLAHLEMRRELGADPVDLIDQETQARIEFHDFLLEQDMSEADRLRLQNQRRQIFHDAEMQRSRAEQAQQRQKLQVYTQVGQGIDTIYQATASAALSAALSEGQSVREAVKSTAKAEAMRASITAGAAFVQAAFWSAVPGGQAKAAQFITAGGMATAQAAVFGALAGSLSGTGGQSGRKFGRIGVGETEGAFGGSAFGGGVAGGGTQPALPGASPSPGAESGVPGSPPPPTRTPGPPQIGTAWSGQRDPSVNFEGAVFHLYGTGGREDFIESVTRDQERLRLKRRS